MFKGYCVGYGLIKEVEGEKLEGKSNNNFGNSVWM